ncbi:ankyrin repeat-containing domain protein, partial [Globomyces pollinis-pini]
GETPLHYAAAAGNLACVKILTEAGAELEKHSRTGLTPLEIAIAAPGSGRLDVIEFLISAAGADIDAKNHENYTAVHVAAIKGFVDIIQYLVSEGCELQTTNVHGQGPLYNAKT